MKTFINFIKTCGVILLTGAIGFWFSQTDDGHDLEAEYGLRLLFGMRGPLPSPQDIIIVSIDRASAEVLRLPDDPEQWPRHYYAQLIDKINLQKPAVLAFNIHFGREHEPASDQLLAKAMAAEKNVILSSYLKQKTLPGIAELGAIHEQIEPIPLFASSALGAPPFPIPRTSSTVKALWAYQHSAGDMATFPVSIYQYYVVKETYPVILQLLGTIDPLLKAKLPNSFEQLTQKFNNLQILQDILAAIAKDDETSLLAAHLIADAQFSPKVKRLLGSWLALSTHDARLYLNHYGDVGAIKTISFYQALVAESTGNPALFRDKIVMIGYSDDLEPEKQQGFYTAYSKTSGNVISPIEIAATGVANMTGQSWLKPLPQYDQSMLVLIWGIALCAMFCLLPFPAAVTMAMLLTGAYFSFCLHLFTTKNIWLPLIIPMLQAAAILIWQIIAHVIKVNQVSGRYLPKDVFSMNIRNPNAMHQYGNLMRGVCLATDAGQYTSLSETVSPLQLHELINEYYAAIFPRVKARKGVISDVLGDAMLAVWAAQKNDDKLRLNACHAALEIKTAVERFNESSPYPLATRMGLHFGDMRLGNVGSREHFEYRAVGDTVNTAARIEGLNKLLDTRILVSASVIDGLQGFVTRELGAFLLKGKTQAVTVFELIGRIDELSTTGPNWPQMAALFAGALACFKGNDWEKALKSFQVIHLDYPEDGPTRFYINYLQKKLSYPAELPNDLSKERASIIDVGNFTI